MAALALGPTIGGCRLHRGSASAAPDTPPRLVPLPERPVDAVVVGAGVAGLAAARDLVAAGRTVIVVEARDRVGGRVYTDRSLARVPVERGAELIHGSNVSTWELVREVGVGTVRMGAERDDTPDSAQGNPATIDLARVPPPAAQENAADYLRRVGLDPDRWPEPVQELELDNEPMRRWSAAELVRLGYIGGDGGGSDDGRDFRVLGGYEQLLRPLVDAVDVALECVVTQIDYSDSGVAVHCVTKTGKHTVRGRVCVVSLPIGVLRHGDVAFSPALPLQHLQAIGTVAAADVAKLIYCFDQPVLPARFAAIVNRTTNPPYFWTSSRGLSSFAGEVVVGWAAGDEARALLRLGDDGAVQAGLDTLRSAVGDGGLSPVRTAVHNWTSDPFARGAYSFVTPGMANPAATLTQPVSTVVFFAGEATSTTDPTTVHGAYDTGRRAARQALHALR
ncbi:flavin monoamine oxidase family protein [Krasilnikovia sp. M28-CT-15]|uniref:flavin monoamine oxidase family protein n=1 Tax=Krasilnikovia sp. M28-CT-15 TaxID=3373540 RepID=UPI003875BBEE